LKRLISTIVMIFQITQGIRVSVRTNFEKILFKNQRFFHLFVYHITIENQSKDTVQLMHSYLEFFDPLKGKEIINDKNVNGEKPVIKSGQSFSFRSKYLSVSPLGAMKGFFTMINFTTTQKFKIATPVFRLATAYALN